MTIAIAATFPWGRLGRAVNAVPGAASIGGIILATDSRFSYDKDYHEDDGQKLWRLAPQIGAVLAGDVYIAEEALEQCERSLRLVTIRREVVAEVVSGTLKEVYAAHKRRRGSQINAVQILVGMASEPTEISILKFDAEHDFFPELEKDVQSIGSARAKFTAKMDEADEAFFTVRGTVWKIGIREWALRLVSTPFSDVVEPGDDDSVGGGIQIATIDRTGWSWCNVDRLRDLTSGVSWEHASVAPDDVKQFMHEKKQPPLASVRSSAPTKRPRAKAKSRPK